MPQLNVHVPASSNLLDRVEAAARQLGTTPSALARVVLDVALEPYLHAQLDLRRQERDYSSRVVASLRDRFSGALPARPFTVAGEPEEAGEAVGPDPGAGGDDGGGATGDVARQVRRAGYRGASTLPRKQGQNGTKRSPRPAVAARPAIAAR